MGLAQDAHPDGGACPRLKSDRRSAVFYRAKVCVVARDEVRCGGATGKSTDAGAEQVAVHRHSVRIPCNRPGACHIRTGLRLGGSGRRTVIDLGAMDALRERLWEGLEAGQHKLVFRDEAEEAPGRLRLRFDDA